ncbi:protein of unknown function [Azospirillum baldaniorum]|uniref:Uncharacterized protein n=1 Tax=Azospirillum baldaniorum TaxID=1064539 RepID=A0A9P1NKT2_9PROT|nr:protein of unknown function [Azospirillum baldaniorum]
MMVMPRSRSMSMLSSTCSRISRESRPPHCWIRRSARVDLPWSMCAMIEKLRMCERSVIGARSPGLGRNIGRTDDARNGGVDRPYGKAPSPFHSFRGKRGGRPRALLRHQNRRHRPVKLHVLLRRAMPAEVTGHRVLLQDVPALGLAVEGGGAAQRPGQLLDVGVDELEAGGAGVVHRRRVGVHDGVGEASGAADQRQGAVLQGVHLGQAAGLRPRGDQEQVGAGLDAVGQRLVVADAHADRLRVPGGEVAEAGLQRRFAAAENGELAAPGDPLRRRLQNQIQPLVTGQAADHRGQRGVRPAVQAEGRLEVGLAQVLAAEVRSAVAGGDVRVDGGVPDVIVHTVEDAGQRLGPRGEQPFQARTVLRRLDFVGVGRADRGQAVGVEAAGLEEADAAVIFHPVDPEGGGRQAEVAHHPGAEQPLVGDVVDRRHRARPERPGEAVGAQFQIGRDQAGLPVVPVQHVGTPPRVEAVLRREARRAPGQGGEAFRVVRPVLAVRPQIGVAGPVVERRRVQHIGQHPVRHAADPQRRRGAAGQIGERSADRLQVGQPVQHRRIAGQQQADLGSGAIQGGGQGGGHIGQPAGLHQGVAFRRDEQDAHGGGVFRFLLGLAHRPLAPGGGEGGWEGSVLGQAVDHVLGDQADAALAAVEALGVQLRVLADDQPLGDHHAAVDHHLGQAAVAADVDVRQDHGLMQLAEGVDAHLAEQQRILHQRAGDDAAARHQAVHRHAAPVLVVEDELRRGQLLLVGEDRPLAVVHVELRRDVAEVEVGLPIGVDGADVAPVGLRLMAVQDGRLGEVVGHHPRPAGHQMGDDVLAEVARRAGIVEVALQLVVEELRVEDVDAHAGQRLVRVSRHRRRVGGLLDEVDDALRLVHMHDAEAGGLGARHLDAGDRHIGLLGDVVEQKRAVIHLVDVVAGQDQDVFRLVVAQDVQVLVHRVGGALVPGGLADALLRRQQVAELVHLAAEEVPAALQVAQQAVRLVLRQHADAAEARIDAVRQGEVDDPELAPEIGGRLGATVGQLLQPAAPAASQDKCHGAARRQPQIPFVEHVSPLSVLFFAVGHPEASGGPVWAEAACPQPRPAPPVERVTVPHFPGAGQ